MSFVNVMRVGRGDDVPLLLRGRFILSALGREDHWVGSLLLWHSADLHSFPHGYLHPVPPDVTAAVRYAQGVGDEIRAPWRRLFAAARDLMDAIDTLQTLIRTADENASVWFTPTWVETRQHFQGLPHQIDSQTLADIERAFVLAEQKADALRVIEDQYFGDEGEEP